MNRRQATISWLLLLFLVGFGLAQRDADLTGKYCRDRTPRSCCPSRDDTCSVPILGTLCYCDMFCNRTSAADCCPDFWEHCMGIQSEPVVRHHCIHGGIRYTAGQSIQLNCNKCTCRQAGYNNLEFACEERACLVRPEIVDAVNRGQHGWSASNYSMFWGKTLEEGIKYRLGTYKPSKPTMEMNEMHMEHKSALPDSFDARVKWPGLIQPIRDQGNCGSSWAFSTTALASDRLAIQSNGEERERLSPQHLISCQNGKQRGCEGGHLDRAWWYLRKKGLSTEQCFPYESGKTSREGPCLVTHNRREVTCPTGEKDYLRYATPPYRVGPKEEMIKEEIFTNGPVQATFRVHEDFFMYRSGVYQKTLHSEQLPAQYRQHGWHSVRILGWGVDRSASSRPAKYWLCDNSWGRLWGEEGYFRIRRGENECDIEMFIVGVWGKRNNLQRHRHRHENRLSNQIRK